MLSPTVGDAKSNIGDQNFHTRKLFRLCNMFQGPIFEACNSGIRLQHPSIHSPTMTKPHFHKWLHRAFHPYSHIKVAKNVRGMFFSGGRKQRKLDAATPFRQVHILTHKSQNSACAPLMSSLGGGHTQDVPPYIQESSSNTGSVSSKSFLSRELYTSAKKGSPWRAQSHLPGLSFAERMLSSWKTMTA